MHKYKKKYAKITAVAYMMKFINKEGMYLCLKNTYFSHNSITGLKM